MSDDSINSLTAGTVEQIVNTDNDVKPVAKPRSNRGRKAKYADDNARKMAKREQNRTYRERKRNELITLRRLAAQLAKDNIAVESTPSA